MKGIAIGLSFRSEVILKRLKKTDFIDEIYIACSTNKERTEEKIIPLIKPKKIFKEKWKDIDLIIIVGSIGASIRLINSFLTSKDQDPGVIVIDNKCNTIVPLIGLHQSNIQNIALQISNLFGGQIIETNNSNDKSYLNLDSFGNQWGWKDLAKYKSGQNLL